MAQFIVIYDSCVLYPAPLRDLLMRLALTDLYHIKWTQEIHKEWMRNLLRIALTPVPLDLLRGLLDLKSTRFCVNIRLTQLYVIINMTRFCVTSLCEFRETWKST